MFKGKLKIFILKRVLILYILLSILDLLLVKERWYGLGGLTVGALYSVIRFGLLEYTFASMLLKNRKTASIGSIVAISVFSIAALVTLLTLSIKLSIWFFTGAAVGILLVPAVIVINGITEALGISKNNFE